MPAVEDRPDPRLQAASLGDRGAAEALLRQLLPRIRNLSRALLGSDRDVDDVAQLVLIQVAKGLKGFRGDGSLTGWCDRITIRTAIAHARQARARAVSSLSDESGKDLEVEDVAADYLAKRQAVELLDVLPVEQRSAVVLHHLLGLSVPEIAEHEAISAETVRSRLRLGMAKLRAESETAKVAS